MKRDSLLNYNYVTSVGLFIILLFIVTAFLAPLIAPTNPNIIHEHFLHVPPFWYEKGNTQFILGTDDIGRDLLSRLIYGSRYSLGMGFLVVFSASIIGTFLGLISGFFRGWIDNTVMRFVDALMAIPSILLAMVVVAVLGPSLFNTVIAVTFVALPGFIRVVRASVLVEKEKDYVVASLSQGASSSRIIWRHILPNSMSPLLVQTSLSFSEAILNIAALGFLGLGAQPPDPEWGVMLSDARAYMHTAPWQVTFPGLFILLVVLSFNLVGDSLRDFLDPKLKKRA